MIEEVQEKEVTIENEKIKEKSPKKKKKIEIKEFLENLKEYLVDDTIINLKDQMIPFDSLKGCTIEEAKSVYQIVCRTGAQKMNASIEFGLYLNFILKNYWNQKIEKEEEFLTKNGFCKKRQANYYKKLSELSQYQRFRYLNYSINDLSSRVDEIMKFFKENSEEKIYWLK